MLGWFCISDATVYSMQLNSYLRARIISRSTQHKKIGSVRNFKLGVTWEGWAPASETLMELVCHAGWASRFVF